MARVFINYRREDVAGAAGRLYDHLAKVMPRADIFMDADAMKPGLDFVAQLDEQVAKCDVLLAVIGKRWLGTEGATGTARLHADNDFVRTEISAALRRGIPVIPILVDNAPMPQEDALPEDLRPLVRRHAMELRHTRFAADADAILEAVADKKRRPRLSPARAFLGVILVVAALAPITLMVLRMDIFHATPPKPETLPASSNTTAGKPRPQAPPVAAKLPQIEQPQAKGAGAPSIEELTVKLGATYDEVRRAYPGAAELTRGDLSMPLDGIRMFFARDTLILNNIRTDAPFIGAVNGVHINDTLDQIAGRLGQPAYVRGNSHFYRIDGNLTRYDLDEAGRVQTVFQLLERK